MLALRRRRGLACSAVLGGEAALWGEHTDGRNLFAGVFMGVSVVAERLWSPRRL